VDSATIPAGVPSENIIPYAEVRVSGGGFDTHGGLLGATEA
jgi:hypothetical protein